MSTKYVILIVMLSYLDRNPLILVILSYRCLCFNLLFKFLKS